MSFIFYKSTYNPQNLTGIVGGSISSNPLSGYLGELFVHIGGPPSGAQAVNQYRKIFIKNTYPVDSTETKIWIDTVEHSEQIAIGTEGSISDTITCATGTAPIATWNSPTSYVNGMNIGTLSGNASTGIWMRQQLTGIVEEDPFATFRLYVGGIVDTDI